MPALGKSQGRACYGMFRLSQAWPARGQQGLVAGGPPLGGAAMDFVRGELGHSLPLHRAQVSVCYPGYPKPSAEESEAA